MNCQTHSVEEMIREVIVGEDINGYGKIFEDHQNIPHRALLDPFALKGFSATVVGCEYITF